MPARVRKLVGTGLGSHRRRRSRVRPSARVRRGRRRCLADEDGRGIVDLRCLGRARPRAGRHISARALTRTLGDPRFGPGRRIGSRCCRCLRRRCTTIQRPRRHATIARPRRAIGRLCRRGRRRRPGASGAGLRGCVVHPVLPALRRRRPGRVRLPALRRSPALRRLRPAGRWVEAVRQSSSPRRAQRTLRSKHVWDRAHLRPQAPSQAADCMGRSPLPAAHSNDRAVITAVARSRSPGC